MPTKREQEELDRPFLIEYSSEEMEIRNLKRILWIAELNRLNRHEESIKPLIK